jgi:urea carboxylase
MWNRFRSTKEFTKPWLLRFFDQIRFYPVSHEELLQLRADFPYGRFSPKIEEGEFRLKDYRAFLESIATDAATFKQRQQLAFDEERERWAAAGFNVAEEIAPTAIVTEIELPEGGRFVDSPVTGNLWKVLVKPGDQVKEGDLLFIVESMKTEIGISAPATGSIHSVPLVEGRPVAAGQHLAALIES